MLTRIYNPDGSRKTFQELALDLEEDLKNKRELQEEIEYFYTEIMYESLQKCSKEELETINEDEFLYSYYKFCYQNKIKMLEQKMNKISEKDSLSIGGEIIKKEQIRKLKNELKNVKKQYEKIEEKGLNL